MSLIYCSVGYLNKSGLLVPWPSQTKIKFTLFTGLGQSVLGKTVPEVLGTQPRAVLNPLSTGFPNTDWPKPVNNIFIFSARKKGLGLAQSRNKSVPIRGQDLKRPPAAGTNKIEWFTEFRPLAHWKKKKFFLFVLCLWWIFYPNYESSWRRDS